MKDFKVSKSKAVLAATFLLLSLALGIPVVLQAAAGDAGTGAGAPLVIAAKQGSTKTVVPNLIGKNKAQTEKALGNAGLKLGEVKFTTSAKGKPGTVVKQKPKANTKMAKGSAVDVVVLRAAAKVSPKIVQRGDKVFMEFPETVKDVTISDEKGNKLQQFKKGKRFDVTESAVATKAGRIKVDWNFSPPDRLYWGGVEPPSGSDIIDIEIDPDFLARTQRLGKEIPKVEPALIRDDTIIDNAEPANNDRNGAVQISGSGLYSGTVGGNDPGDFVKIIIGPHQPGTLVTASVWSGSVKLSLDGSQVNHVDALWGAAVPGETCYLKITPAAGETPYTILVSTRPVYDVHEPNDDFQSATPIALGSSVNGCLCNFWDWNGPPQTGEDWYQMQMPNPQWIKIKISSAGLKDNDVTLKLYSPDNQSVPFRSITGTNDEAELEVNFPVLFTPATWQSQGYHTCCWRIRVSPDHYSWPCGSELPPPDSYRPYRLVVETIPFVK